MITSVQGPRAVKAYNDNIDAMIISTLTDGPMRWTALMQEVAAQYQSSSKSQSLDTRQATVSVRARLLVNAGKLRRFANRKYVALR